MIIIPAIDLRAGKVVRLSQGKFDEETVYSDNPLACAQRFYSEGAQRLHVVDLEGARTGTPQEQVLIEKLIAEIPARFQVGGGIRNPETIDAYLKKGAFRVILGTQACLDKGFLKEVMKQFGESLIVSVDAIGGYVAIEGWTQVTDCLTEAFIERILIAGGREIVLTDIDKDGRLKGPNVEQTKRILEHFSIQVIASGGISSLEDIRLFLNIRSKNLLGLIIGKAFYDGNIALKNALELCSQNESSHA